jgi:hypothetical protein
MQDDPLLCHQLERTVCDLIRRCGDGHGGKRFSSCQFEKLKYQELTKELLHSASDNLSDSWENFFRELF